VHAVGPLVRKESTDKAEVLKQAVINALTKAEELGAATVALPPISCGVFMYPKKEASQVIFDGITEYLKSNRETPIKTLRLVIKDMTTLSIFTKEFVRRFPEDLSRIKLE
jgi:O-acetyl-ADP-ribose deacetylase (regulator of RNase III)